MALFDIRYISSSGILAHKMVHTLGNSPEEAIKIFGFRWWNDPASFHVDRAIRLKHEWDTQDKVYWRTKWNTSLDVMPHKIKRSKTIDWIVCPKGSVSVPEFIKQRAKNTMKMLDGHVIRQKITYTEYEYGRIANLAILLGYITTGGVKTKRPRANCCALQGRKIPEGSRPRNPRTRKLLASIPGMSKAEIESRLAAARKRMKRYAPHKRS